MSAAPGSLAQRLASRFACRDGGARDYWRGMEAVLSVATTRADDEHRALGRLLSVPFAAFAIHVLDESRRLGIDRLYFLAREGAVFMRICRRLARARGDAMPRATYLGASRASTFLPSMRDLSLGEIARVWYQYPRQSFSRLLRNLSLDADVFGAHARRCGVGDLDAPINNLLAHAGLARFLTDDCVRRDFVAARDRARELLAAYLRERGWFDATFAGIVDVGWKGSMQTNLWRAAAPARLHGMYLALSPIVSDDVPGCSRAGFLADTRADDWAQDQVLLNGPVFEMFATARHGSVRGYERRSDRGGRVRPVVEHHAEEAENFRGVFARVHRGIDDGLCMIARMGGWRGLSGVELRPAVLDLVRRYVVYPTRREADLFTSYSHVENFGVYETARYEFTESIGRLISSGPVASALQRIRDAVLRHLWPPGVVRRSGVPLANALLDAELTRRARR
ncbi:MAG: hypothetical protein IT432_09910 [Phycisphaerales bacterium]|nr:hypothetical protein [Phycisphaerales bacterium]